jgi:hypothetical protein
MHALSIASFLVQDFSGYFTFSLCVCVVEEYKRLELNGYEYFARWLEHAETFFAE